MVAISLPEILSAKGIKIDVKDVQRKFQTTARNPVIQVRQSATSQTAYDPLCIQ